MKICPNCSNVLYPMVDIDIVIGYVCPDCDYSQTMGYVAGPKGAQYFVPYEGYPDEEAEFIKNVSEVIELPEFERNEEIPF